MGNLRACVPDILFIEERFGDFFTKTLIQGTEFINLVPW
jgi:hypothetical protein